VAKQNQPVRRLEIDGMEVPLSSQSLDLIRRLATYGIYGATVEEVVARFIDEGLAKFCPTPDLEP
jgi:hypothetical protein